MKVFELNYPNGEFPSMPCGLVLGNFDGVHRGHLALVKELKRLNKTRKQRLPLGAFCFEQHPSQHFGKPVALLCDNDQKIELFRQAGLQFVIFCDFAEFKDMPPEEFVAKFLIHQCQCRMAVCGFNYSFGKKGAGNADVLKKLCDKGFAENVDTIVRPLIGRDRVQAYASSHFVDQTFDGSLPGFLAAFLGGKTISSEEAEALKQLIDRHKED